MYYAIPSLLNFILSPYYTIVKCGFYPQKKSESADSLFFVSYLSLSRELYDHIDDLAVRDLAVAVSIKSYYRVADLPS